MSDLVIFFRFIKNETSKEHDFPFWKSSNMYNQSLMYIWYLRIKFNILSFSWIRHTISLWQWMKKYLFRSYWIELFKTNDFQKQYYMSRNHSLKCQFFIKWNTKEICKIIKMSIDQDYMVTESMKLHLSNTKSTSLWNPKIWIL